MSWWHAPWAWSAEEEKWGGWHSCPSNWQAAARPRRGRDENGIRFPRNKRKTNRAKQVSNFERRSKLRMWRAAAECREAGENFDSIGFAQMDCNWETYAQKHQEKHAQAAMLTREEVEHVQATIIELYFLKMTFKITLRSRFVYRYGISRILDRLKTGPPEEQQEEAETSCSDIAQGSEDHDSASDKEEDLRAAQAAISEAEAKGSEAAGAGDEPEEQEEKNEEELAAAEVASASAAKA